MYQIQYNENIYNRCLWFYSKAIENSVLISDNVKKKKCITIIYKLNRCLMKKIVIEYFKHSLKKYLI